MRRMMTEIALAVCLLLILLVASDALAGIKAKVGKWKFDATSTNPVTGRSDTHSSTDCLKDGDVDPRKFMEEAQECTVSDVQTTESSMDWQIRCVFEGGSMSGEGHFETVDKSASGFVKGRVDAGAHTMNFEHRYAGTWLGPCD